MYIFQSTNAVEIGRVLRKEPGKCAIEDRYLTREKEGQWTSREKIMQLHNHATNHRHLYGRNPFCQEHGVHECPHQTQGHDRELGHVVQGEKDGAPDHPWRESPFALMFIEKRYA